MSRARDIEILKEALALERGAVERYAEQSARTSDPRLLSFWESVRRNECGHRDALLAALAGFGEPAPNDEAPTPAPSVTKPSGREAT
ncbi:MAG: hypothetical protein ACLQUT_11245 [Thermoleophilia bacterium]